MPRDLTEVQSAIELFRCQADLLSDFSVGTLQQVRFQTCRGVVMIEREDDRFFRVRRQTIRKCLHNHRIGGIAGLAFALSSGLDDQVKRKTNADTTFDSLDLVLAIGVERDVLGGLLQPALGQNQTGVVGPFPKQSVSLV